MPADSAQCVHLGIGVRHEMVQRHHDGHAELAHVFHVLPEIPGAFFQGLHVFRCRVGLGCAPMQLQRAAGNDDDRGRGCQPRLAALDIEELLRAQVRAEAGLGNRVIAQRQRQLGRHHRVATMGDVRERPAMHEGGRALQRLHQVGRQRVAHQHGHGAVRLEVAGAHHVATLVLSHHHVAQALLEVAQILRQTQHGHRLGSHGDVEAGFARHAIAQPAQAQIYVAQRAVVHVQHTAPNEPAHVQAQLVTLLEMIVDHRGEQVVRRGDGVNIPREVQVDVLHGDDLRVAAARRAALDAKAGAQRRLAQADHGFFAHPAQPVPQAHGHGRLALARRGGIDPRHQHQLAREFILDLIVEFQGNLGLVGTVRHQMFMRNAQLVRDGGDGFRIRLLGNFNIAEQWVSPTLSCSCAD